MGDSGDDLSPHAEPPEDRSPEEIRALRRTLLARQARVTRGGHIFAFALVAVVAAGVLLRLPESWWVPAVGALALAAVVFRLTTWTCPACGERLPGRRGRACPGCGLLL